MASAPHVVAFGGGTGMPCLLRGLKMQGADITAVVVVSDDGGSSGELRHLYNMPAPGDLRNVILSLSNADSKLVDLLQHRFEGSVLEGHALGNLALAALTRMEGSFEGAVKTLCRLLHVEGRVIPSSLDKVSLVAEHTDGTLTTGEVKVSRSDKPIRKVSLRPEPRPVPAETVAKVRQADLLVFGPGSLFTSIIPHLLIPGMKEALAESVARVVYVSNLMTQPGETSGFALRDHVSALLGHGLPRLDAVLCHEGPLSPSMEKSYFLTGSRPVLPQEVGQGVALWVEDLASEEGGVLRHDPQRLASSLLSRSRMAAV
ncbi:MAG: uridine diphosphate-N-acetylglucosamine-binding protein YvcK [Planctomycetota bacterium]